MSSAPPGMMPPGAGPGTSGDPTAAIRDPNIGRTEFIILFVWKEPTPSDALMSKPEGTP